MKRRTFLQGSALGAATLMVPRRARAADIFGEFPSAQRGVQLPEGSRVNNVLEIYLYGGLSPWETFYFVDEYGRNNGTFYYAFEDVPDGFDSNALALSQCGVDVQSAQPSFFAQDELGNDVQLGPYAFALRERPDMIERLRLVVMQHDLLPHEAAVPYAVSGKRVGQPSLSGLGAHIQRYFGERGGQRRSPFAYVLSNAGAIPSDNTAALFAVGTHPGSARPLSINVDVIQELGVLLDREGIARDGDLEKHDVLVEAYVNRFRNRLRHEGRNLPLRSKRLQELEAAARAAGNAAAVKDLISPLITALPTLDLCGSGPTTNVPARSLEMAAHLLTHPTEAARYVCVLDTGLIGADGGGGYDTHAEQCVPTARNFTNIIRGLANVTNAPGESDPRKIDLDDTLVLLTTEFGRTPYVQEGVGGRNHHPAGYVTAMLGGPIRERGIIGAIDDNGNATSASTPAESRMAALLALGIFPFSGDSFFLSDVPGEAEELEAVKRVTRTFLGVDL